MKTSKIKIRPFIPWAKDEEKEGREPFAVLTYNNITVELDYTVMHAFHLDGRGQVKTMSIVNAAMEEIRREMANHDTGTFGDYHRDGKRGGYNSLFSHNMLHPSNDEIEQETEEEMQNRLNKEKK